MSACKCGICGKFRKDSDMVLQEYSCWDGMEVDQQFECKFCMSQVDFERYFPEEDCQYRGLCEKNSMKGLEKVK
jgi:hypothetical protein